MTTSGSVNQGRANARTARRDNAGKGPKAAVAKRTPTQRSSASDTRSDKDAQGDSAVRAKVQKFLDRFSQAMTTGDTGTMVKLWALPAIVIDVKDARVVQSSAELERFFSGAPAMYQERGIVDTRGEIQWLDVIDERLVMVLVRWAYLDMNANEIGEESSTYTLRTDEKGEFKMCVCAMRGEKKGTPEAGANPVSAEN